jgi:Zn-finger nucleic acid-binding protein
MPSRRCIKCDQDLEPSMLLEVEVDFCPRCRGIWLDQGEILELASDRAAALAQVVELEKKVARLEGMGLVTESKVLQSACPACAGKLAVARFGPTAIEVCISCQGMFLDRGELEKAMAVVEGGEAATIVAFARSVHTSGTIGR